MTEVLSPHPRQAIIDSARIVSVMLQQHYVPFEQQLIDDVNNASYNRRNQNVLVSGSEVFFETLDVVDQSPIQVAEFYIYYLCEGEAKDEHQFGIQVKHPRNDYSIGINLDTHEMGIETKDLTAVFKPERYPAVTKRILGSLAIVANELI